MTQKTRDLLLFAAILLSLGSLFVSLRDFRAQVMPGMYDPYGSSYGTYDYMYEDDATTSDASSADAYNDGMTTPMGYGASGEASESSASYFMPYLDNSGDGTFDGGSESSVGSFTDTTSGTSDSGSDAPAAFGNTASTGNAATSPASPSTSTAAPSDDACVPVAEICTNTFDDDCDTMTDGDDSDCGNSLEMHCDDGLDNDGDGYTDHDDSDCRARSGENCVNGMDDDGDMLIDSADTDDCPSGSAMLDTSQPSVTRETILEGSQPADSAFERVFLYGDDFHAAADEGSFLLYDVDAHAAYVADEGEVSSLIIMSPVAQMFLEAISVPFDALKSFFDNLYFEQ